MASPDYNVCIPLKEVNHETQEETTRWYTLGRAWVTQKGIQLILNAHPIGREIMLFRHNPEFQEENSGRRKGR